MLNRRAAIIFYDYFLLGHGELLIELHEFSDTGAFSGSFDIKAVSLHDGFVICLMGFAQLRRHRHLVIKVGKTAIGVEISGVENCLRRLLDLRFLRFGRRRPREIVVDYIYRISVITFYPATHSPYPSIMNIR